MPLGYDFVPLPTIIWDRQIDLTQGEFRLLGWFCRGLRLGVEQRWYSDDEILKGIQDQPPLGMPRNSLKNSRKGLIEKGLIKVRQVSRTTSLYSLTFTKEAECQTLTLDVTDESRERDAECQELTLGVSKVDTRRHDSNLKEEDKEDNTCHSLFPVKTESGRSTNQAIEDVFAYYRNAIGKSPAYTLTPKRLSMGVKRYEESWKKLKGTPNQSRAVALMLLAIDALSESDFHMARGKYAGGTQYNDWEQLFRSTEQFEKWIERAAA